MTRIRKVELLDYHASKCPHCGREIFVPEYRQTPVTLEEMRRETRAYMKRIEKGAEVK